MLADSNHVLDESEIKIADDSLLSDIYSVLPEGWNISVVVDKKEQNGYAVHGATYCGDKKECRFTVQVGCYVEPQLSVQFTDLTAEEADTRLKIGPPQHTGQNNNIKKIIEAVSDAIYGGYLQGLPSPMYFFDALHVGELEKFHNELESENYSRTEWANIRGVSKETISSNISALNDYLDQLPDIDPFTLRQPALREVDTESEVIPDVTPHIRETDRTYIYKSNISDIDVSIDEIFEVIKPERHRLLLAELQNKPLSIEELSGRIAALRNEKPISSITKKEHNYEHQVLYKHVLSTLDDLGVLKFDSEEETVKLTEDGAKISYYPTHPRIDNDETNQLSLDQIFDILKAERRRHVLEILRKRSEEIQLKKLSKIIAAVENNKHIDEVTTEEGKMSYVMLYQCHCPKMDDLDVIEFNGTDESVSLSTNSKQVL